MHNTNIFNGVVGWYKLYKNPGLSFGILRCRVDLDKFDLGEQKVDKPILWLDIFISYKKDGEPEKASKYILDCLEKKANYIFVSEARLESYDTEREGSPLKDRKYKLTANAKNVELSISPFSTFNHSILDGIAIEIHQPNHMLLKVRRPRFKGDDTVYDYVNVFNYDNQININMLSKHVFLLGQVCGKHPDMSDKIQIPYVCGKNIILN